MELIEIHDKSLIVSKHKDYYTKIAQYLASKLHKSSNSLIIALKLGMYRLSIQYSVSPEYLTTRYYSDSVK